MSYRATIDLLYVGYLDTKGRRSKTYKQVNPLALGSCTCSLNNLILGEYPENNTTAERENLPVHHKRPRARGHELSCALGLRTLRLLFGRHDVTLYQQQESGHPTPCFAQQANMLPLTLPPPPRPPLTCQTFGQFPPPQSALRAQTYDPSTRESKKWRRRWRCDV